MVKLAPPYSTLFSAAIFVLIGISPLQAAWLNSKDTTTMTEAKTDYWTYDYAIELMEKSANLSYGIQDYSLFEKILAQKDKGDPNALFVYAFLLRNYNVVNEEVRLSRAGANMTAFNIYWDLSEQGHPQACDQLFNFEMNDILRYKKLTEDDLIAKLKTCAKLALKNQLTNYIDYADIFAFGLDGDDGYDLLLSQSENLSNKKDLEEAIKIYELGARYNGYDYYIARVAEAYYEGIGVKKDIIKAAAWAKLMIARSKVISTFAYSSYVNQLNTQFEQDPEIQNAPEFKQLYQTLKETIPMSPYAKKADK